MSGLALCANKVVMIASLSFLIVIISAVCPSCTKRGTSTRVRVPVETVRETTCLLACKSVYVTCNATDMVTQCGHNYTQTKPEPCSRPIASQTTQMCMTVMDWPHLFLHQDYLSQTEISSRPICTNQCLVLSRGGRLRWIWEVMGRWERHIVPNFSLVRECAKGGGKKYQ